MKKLMYLTFILATGIAISCQQDKSLDPFQLDKVKKGTLLALRGTFFDNLQTQNANFNYCGAVIVANSISATSTETFAFDAEYLAENTDNTLQSCDIYVKKRTPLPSGDIQEDRVLLTNIPFSQFKKDATYARPWVSISLKQNDILAKIGIKNFDANDINTLMTTYQYGVNIEIDLNLTDGTIAPASAVVAAGLFQSVQFYPAQKLTYCVE